MTKRSRLKSVDEEYEEEESTPQAEPLKAVSINEILDKDIPPIRYIIPDILHEGLCIVASPPKTGKSRLVLAVAIRMAKKLTGGIDGEVLYLSLDDASERRLQDRARGLLQGEEVEDKVWIAFESASIGKGLEQQLDWWMEDHPDTRLIIIDVFGHVKPQGKSKELYMNDTKAMKPLRELALKHHIAIQLVHHTRKAMDKGDPMSNISGTNGLWGGADQGWMLSREDLTDTMLLYVKGREPYEGVLSVDLNDIHAPWNEVGWDDKAARDTETVEDKIMVELLGQGCVIGPKRISELTGISTSTINKELRRMTDKGLITQTSRGAYGIPELLGQSGKVAEDTPILATLPLSSPVENSHTNSGKPICPMCQRCACALGQQRELLLYYPPSLNSRCDAQGDDEMRDIDRLFRFYKLSDPLDGDIRYIGVTARSLDERIREHIRDTKGSRGQSLLYRRNIFTWIDELLLDDRTPSIIQLEELRTIENRALYREKQWIYHHARLGYQLLNVSHSGGYYYLLRLTEGTEDNLIEYKTFKCIEWVIKKLHYYHFSSHDRRRYLRTEIMSYMRRAGLSQEICNRVSSSMSYMDHGGQSGGFKYQGEDK